MPFTGGRRPVRKNMSEVAATARRRLLDAMHSMTGVRTCAGNMVSISRVAQESRPPGPRIELVLELKSGRPQKRQV